MYEVRQWRARGELLRYFHHLSERFAPGRRDAMLKLCFPLWVVAFVPAHRPKPTAAAETSTRLIDRELKVRDSVPMAMPRTSLGHASEVAIGLR